jgi:hypothetical protein
MTSYASEKDYLLDQIESNKEAIEFIEHELEKVLTEMPEDHAGTKEKIVSVYTRGIEYLKRDNRQIKKKIVCTDPILESMRNKGIKLTQEAYLGLAYPEGMNSEAKATLPEEFYSLPKK